MQFIKGMDISMLGEMENLGASYFNNGVRDDLFNILRQYGVNSIRLRLWVNPFDEQGNSYGGGCNDIQTTMELAQRAVDSGMSFLLDIHYSDFWSDPAKQMKPKSWRDLDADALENQIYHYTQETLEKFSEKGLIPEYLQIGNELTNGLLWPEGKLPNYDGMVRLLKSGIAAARKINNCIKIILHLDDGGNNSLYRSWFDKITAQKVDFDIIGLSYYPYWHGTLEELEYNMRDIGLRYNKDLMVVETALGFTIENGQSEAMIFNKEIADKTPYSPTPEGQSKFIADLLKLISDVPDNRGKGFYYWEPAWILTSGSSWATDEGRKYLHDKTAGGNSWANQALFDFNGNVLPAMEIIRDF